MIQIYIPFKTPTVNHLYGHHGGRKYLKKEARDLREKIKDLVPKHNFSKDSKLFVRVRIVEDWYTKVGVIKKKDVANREKFLIDSIFHALGIDDKQIFVQLIEKIQSEKYECANVMITEMKGGVIINESINCCACLRGNRP